MEYPRELVASLGYDLKDGFGSFLPEALARATPEQRRHAALWTLNPGN